MLAHSSSSKLKIEILNSYHQFVHHVIQIYASHKSFMLCLSEVLGTHPVPSHRQKSACRDFSVIFLLWRQHSCKLSLCNGEAVAPAPPRGSVSVLQPPCPFQLLSPIIALSPAPIRPTCDCDQGCDAFKAGRRRVLSITFKHCWRFLSPLPSETPSGEYVTNTTYKMWFWFCICLPLYASSV